MPRTESMFARALSQEIMRKQQALEQERQRLLKIEREKLTAWLEDQNNIGLVHYEPFRQAKFVISEEDSAVALADYKALNDAIETKDATSLFERAMEHMEYQSPAAIVVGATMAIAGLMMLAFVAGPLLLVTAGTIAMLGLTAFGLGLIQHPTFKTATFFNAVKAIDPELAECADLLKLPSP